VLGQWSELERLRLCRAWCYALVNSELNLVGKYLCKLLGVEQGNLNDSKKRGDL